MVPFEVDVTPSKLLRVGRPTPYNSGYRGISLSCGTSCRSNINLPSRPTPGRPTLGGGWRRLGALPGGPEAAHRCPGADAPAYESAPCYGARAGLRRGVLHTRHSVLSQHWSHAYGAGGYHRYLSCSALLLYLQGRWPLLAPLP